MRLNKNQILNRVTNAMKTLRSVTDGLDPEDIRAIVEHCTKLLLPAAEAEAAPLDNADMQKKILHALRTGLNNSDPQMVRAAMDYQAEHAGREYLAGLVVNIVPYTVRDTSLRNIVLKAGDDVVSEIEEALAIRKNAGRVEDAPPAEDAE